MSAPGWLALAVPRPGFVSAQARLKRRHPRPAGVGARARARRPGRRAHPRPRSCCTCCGPSPPRRWPATATKDGGSMTTSTRRAIARIGIWVMLALVVAVALALTFTRLPHPWLAISGSGTAVVSDRRIPLLPPPEPEAPDETPAPPPLASPAPHHGGRADCNCGVPGTSP